jgi:predicted flavoprotein YhiN
MLMAKQKDRHVMEALGKTRVVVENGEVIDVTGQPGGYNLHWAWSSGFVAGQYV